MVLFWQARTHPLTRDICSLIQGDPAAVLVIEVQGEDYEAVVAISIVLPMDWQDLPMPFR